MTKRAVHKASAFAELSSMIVTEDKVAGTGLPLSFIEESQIIDFSQVVLS